jgi:GT2 family glycosyltransferase
VDFVGSLRASHPDATPDQVVIVDDGLSEDTRHLLRDVTFVQGVKPFVFARAINMGARAEPERDIVIAGDDVRFLTANLIDKLASQSKGVAAISPEVIGFCGQKAQQPRSTASVSPWLAFICVYIPRMAWNAIGELDEDFVGYGYDDMDWSVRAFQYGPLLVDHSLRIAHIDASSFRKSAEWVKSYEQNLAVFEAKWGKLERAA